MNVYLRDNEVIIESDKYKLYFDWLDFYASINDNQINIRLDEIYNLVNDVLNNFITEDKEFNEKCDSFMESILFL